MASRDAKIAELVLRTQNASDGGKGIDDLVNSARSVTDNKAAYVQKDRLLLATIELINGGKSNWRFAVADCGDFSRRCWIVYFQTRINGEKVQVSFHTFNGEVERFRRNSFRIKWDHGDSRESAQLAYKFYCPNGRY